MCVYQNYSFVARALSLALSLLVLLESLEFVLVNIFVNHGLLILLVLLVLSFFGAGATTSIVDEVLVIF